MTKNKKDDFVNYWNFLNIPMNSPISIICEAFHSKWDELITLFASDPKSNTYCINNLLTLIDAFLTLTDPYKRFLHNCEIDGDDPDDILKYDFEEIEYEKNSYNDSLLTEDAINLLFKIHILLTHYIAFCTYYEKLKASSLEISEEMHNRFLSDFTIQLYHIYKQLETHKKQSNRRVRINF